MKKYFYKFIGCGLGMHKDKETWSGVYMDYLESCYTEYYINTCIYCERVVQVEQKNNYVKG